MSKNFLKLNFEIIDQIKNSQTIGFFNYLINSKTFNINQKSTYIFDNGVFLFRKLISNNFISRYFATKIDFKILIKFLLILPSASTIKEFIIFAELKYQITAKNTSCWKYEEKAQICRLYST